MIKYLTKWVYEEKTPSYEQKQKLGMFVRRFSALPSDQLKELYQSFFETNNSQFIIEEPEMNLFPETQRDLVYHLLNKCLEREGNRLTITTHSPYILYALNNCMMAGLVYDKMDEESKSRLKCDTSKISPSDVSIYEIQEGVVKRVQKEDGLIQDNYFDQQMGKLMDDFYLMLNYYP